MRTSKRTISTFVAICLVALMVQFAPLNASAGAPGNGKKSDQKIATELTKSLDKSQFKGVQVDVRKGIVTLTGTVDSFVYKADAEKRAHRMKDALAVRNSITVAGVRVDEKELQQKLIEKLEYDRVGYGTTAFNAISVEVRDGVVTLGGHAYGPMDKESAIATASSTPGVQDVIDEIEVDPVSPMDDRIRIDVARAVYGHPSLSRYGIDPGRPIRISVQNGNVTLYGAVDNKGDSDVAYLKANSVAGVFSVANRLQVAGEDLKRE